MIKPIADVCPHCFEHLAHIHLPTAKYWLDLCDKAATNNDNHFIINEPNQNGYIAILENLNYILTTDVLAEKDCSEIHVKMFGYSDKSYYHKDFCLTPDICN